MEVLGRFVLVVSVHLSGFCLSLKKSNFILIPLKVDSVLGLQRVWIRLFVESHHSWKY